MRGEHIESTLCHDAGAYAKCSFCKRYTDDRAVMMAMYQHTEAPLCECGRGTGWCGSFEKPTEDSQWSSHYNPDNNVSEYEQYEHHGKMVWVKSELKNRHREFCLCFNCAKFKPGTTENCPIANQTFGNCVKNNLVTPVFECEVFECKE
jgi:hypothetical protein